MLPLAYLTIWAVIVISSGLAAYQPLAGSIHPAVFAWLWFNLFIAAYEAHVVILRKKFSKTGCPGNFWKEPVQDGFWLKAWHEYTCYSDTRYLDYNDPVFVIEGLNAAIVLVMWIALLFGAYTIIMPLLLLQALNCILYFVTLYKSGKTTKSHKVKAISYLLMSSLWIIVPLVLVLGLVFGISS